ncbi:unnamed protein product [Lepeophtheirus salmonis]|uniref:(salmon louse) hypothetical protein n=1 Tax=Lepeophtheirus salmonis TaxID=72036 RepID=A0A7R8H5W0_LEPSM|nr:unnamed protein product [Lepeophtheirus salmonis]CAF2874607.1 unnamed protein product [Lepeophtheirus salmonis]
MTGPLMKIQHKEGPIVHFKCLSLHKILIHYEDIATNELENYLKMGVIKKCEDYTKLNKVGKLSYLQFPQDRSVVLSIALRYPKTRSSSDLTMKFAGFITCSERMKPDLAKVYSISNFPIPHNISELRIFLGLANQLPVGHPGIAHATIEMRKVLKS